MRVRGIGREKAGGKMSSGVVISALLEEVNVRILWRFLSILFSLQTFLVSQVHKFLEAKDFEKAIEMFGSALQSGKSLIKLVPSQYMTKFNVPTSFRRRTK